MTHIVVYYAVYQQKETKKRICYNFVAETVRENWIAFILYLMGLFFGMKCGICSFSQQALVLKPYTLFVLVALAKHQVHPLLTKQFVKHKLLFKIGLVASHPSVHLKH